jgi:hypothetical protein
MFVEVEESQPLSVRGEMMLGCARQCTSLFRRARIDRARHSLAVKRWTKTAQSDAGCHVYQSKGRLWMWMG